MQWTRGGGGGDNAATRESNERRAEAMTGLAALPRYDSVQSAVAQMSGPGFAYVDGQLGLVTPSVAGPSSGQQASSGNTPSTAGPGAGGVEDTPNVPGPGGRARATVGAGSIGQGVQLGDFYLFPDERFPNVEDFWEPRYGEPGELVGGIVNMTVDAIGPQGNLERWLQEEAAKAVKVEPGSIADHVITWAQSGNVMSDIKNVAAGVGEGARMFAAHLDERKALLELAAAATAPQPQTVTVKRLPPLDEPGWRWLERHNILRFGGEVSPPNYTPNPMHLPGQSY